MICPVCGKKTILDRFKCPRCGNEPFQQAPTDAHVKTSQEANPLRYAGFWVRLGSGLLDTLIFIPLGIFTFYCGERYRLFNLYYFIPGILIGFFYSVYLVQRFGGTPGKLIIGIRIRKVMGEPVTYREAFLRYLPELIFGVLISISLLMAILKMSDAEYHALSFMARSKRLDELVPSWYKLLLYFNGAWWVSEFIVLLTNWKKRALHDFIAGTVVVHASSLNSPKGEG